MIAATGDDKVNLVCSLLLLAGERDQRVVGSQEHQVFGLRHAE